MSSADGAYVARNMAFFDPENFNNEPICCTATVENDKDILCEGSDDDAYPTAADRLRRYEERANNFLEGTRPLILSARLRGPFDKDSGWINPWASKRPPAKKKAPKRKRAATTTTTRPPRKRKKGLGELPVVEELPMEEQLPEVNPTTVPGDRNHQDPAARRVYLDDDKADRVREWADKIAPDFEPVASFSGFEEALGAPPRRGPRRKRKDSSRRTSSAIPPDDQDAPSERESFADASHVAIALGTPKPTEPPFSSSLSPPPSYMSDLPRLSTPRTRVPSARKAARRTLELGTPTNGDLTLGSHDISLGVTSHGCEIVDSVEVQMARKIVESVEVQMARTQGKRQEEQPAATPHAASRPSPAPADNDSGFLTCSDRSFRFRAKPQQAKKKAPQIRLPEPLQAEPVQAKPRPKRLLAIADLLNTPAPQRNSNNAAKDGQTPYLQAESANKPSNDPVDAKQPTIDPVAVNEPALPPLHLLPIIRTNLPQMPEFLPPVTLPSIGTSIPQLSGPQPVQEQMNTPRPSSRQQAASEEDHVTVHILENAAVAEETEMGSEPALDVPVSEETELTQKLASVPSTQGTTPIPSGALSPSVSNYLAFGLDLGTFSFEKQQSQTPISAPRKLLWPKSQQPHASPTSSEQPSAALQLPELELGLGISVSRAIPSSSDTPLESNLAHTSTLPVISPSGASPSQLQNPQKAIPEHEPEETAPSGVISTTTPSTSPSKSLQVPVHAPAHENAPKTLEYTDTDIISEPAAETEVPELPQAKAKQSPSRSLSQTASSPQQSPWSRGTMVPSTPTEAIAAIAQEDGVPVIDLGEQLEVSNDLPQLVQQSPWARGDSQVTALVKPRPLSPILSPFSSPRLPEPEILEPVLPQLRATEKTTPSDPSQPPTTPERLTSSLPTPEFTHPIKSFREFMTPSPPKRRPLAPKSSNGRFPSTQVLEEAAVSNPWARMSCTQPPRSATSSLRKIRKTKTKTKKSVSWAPLPDEPEQQPHTPSTKPTPATRSTPTPTPTLRSRPASPPPSSLVSAEDLPISEQKFAKHFAAVKAARRRLSGMRNGMRRGSTTPTLWKMKNAPQLLPSESQQICPSPAMGAMAEAFLRADEVLNLGVQGVEEEGKELGAEAGLVEEGEEEEEDEHEETQQSVDDVSHVLENLDDFLGSWDVETELEKERKESRKGKENRKEGEEEEGWMRREGGMSVGLGLGAMGMADELLGKGVWD